jgi:2-dehydropantoate 2-reductase
MSQQETIYVLGGGSIGLPLAAFLARAGRTVVAVRTSRQDIPAGVVPVTLRSGDAVLRVPVETISLAELVQLNGTIVVTTKAYANQAIAGALKAKGATGPIIIMQNGVGVEEPFLDALPAPIYRCVLYITSQAVAPHDFSVRPVTASPIGIIRGSDAELQRCVAALTTDSFPFRAEANIQREIWKKAIINAVFNSICPLLDADNGVFARDAAAASLGREIVAECVALTDRLGLELGESEIMEQLRRISERSDGQLISTLQDIRHGRPTEIAFLNLAISQVAAELQPSLSLPRTELLGKMIVVKAAQGRGSQT